MDGRKKSQCDGRMEWNQHMSKLSIVTVYHMEMSTKTKYKVYIKTSVYNLHNQVYIYIYNYKKKRKFQNQRNHLAKYLVILASASIGCSLDKGVGAPLNQPSDV
jgi:hypothetical protein